jgi:hypothetical protein
MYLLLLVLLLLNAPAQELNLANNQLAFIPNPPLLERLASLDISYNDLTAATLSEQFFRSLPHLTTLGTDTKFLLPLLQVLNASQIFPVMT